jgi:hypothetical protein
MYSVNSINPKFLPPHFLGVFSHGKKANVSFDSFLDIKYGK